MTEQHALLALHLIPNVGGATIRSLMAHFGSAAKVFSRGLPQLEKVNGVGKVIASQIRTAKTGQIAEQQIQRAIRKGVEIIPYTDPKYPKALLNAYDAPLLLYSRGKPVLNHDKVIAIVGTRKATSYGIDFTRNLVEDLRVYNPLIVSGLAYGIDIEAHRAALAHGLQTVGVVASGVDIIYPSIHKSTAAAIEKQGAIVSEYPLGETPVATNFPARNRIIAGMVEAVIVVEAALKGGALITAHFANDYNREVFALPGNIHQPYSLGTNHLIRDHKARIITGAEDLTYALNWNIEQKASNFKIPENMDADERRVFDAMQTDKEISIDNLSWKSSIPLNKLASVLLNMEFKGYIDSIPGSKYRLSRRLR